MCLRSHSSECSAFTALRAAVRFQWEASSVSLLSHPAINLALIPQRSAGRNLHCRASAGTFEAVSRFRASFRFAIAHPVPKKAIREAYDAQNCARADNLPKAIAKLEKAIRLPPSLSRRPFEPRRPVRPPGRTATLARSFKRPRYRTPRAPPLCRSGAGFPSLASTRRPRPSLRRALELDPAIAPRRRRSNTCQPIDMQVLKARFGWCLGPRGC